MKAKIESLVSLDQQSRKLERPFRPLEPLKPLDLRDPGALHPLTLVHWSPERAFIPWTLSLWILGTPDLAYVCACAAPGNYLPYSFTGIVSEHRSKDNMVAKLDSPK